MVKKEVLEKIIYKWDLKNLVMEMCRSKSFVLDKENIISKSLYVRKLCRLKRWKYLVYDIMFICWGLWDGGRWRGDVEFYVKEVGLFEG